MNKSLEKSVPEELDGIRLDKAVKNLFEEPWNTVRRWIELGKISLAGTCVTDPSYPVRPGLLLVYTSDAPKPKRSTDFNPSCVLFQDKQIIVAVKPAGILTTPFQREDKGTFDRQIRSHLTNRTRKPGRRRGARPPLMLVHRLDKDTSGVLVFARTSDAKTSLSAQFKEHSIRREYLALVHGKATSKTIVSHIMDDRGDGIRGSSETSPHGAVRRSGKGQRAVTHVQLEKALNGASLIRCRLETGRTNQIRIHMAEDGHPLIGERIYMRGYRGDRIRAERLMLHAALLELVHPITNKKMSFESPPPPEFETILRRLSE